MLKIMHFVFQYFLNWLLSHLNAYILATTPQNRLLSNVITGNFEVCLCWKVVNNQNYKTVTSTGDVELRESIKFCVELDQIPSDTLKMLQSSSMTKECSRALVFMWHRRFREGKCSLEDDNRCGRQSKMKCSISEKTKDMVYSDRQHTLRNLASELDFFHLYSAWHFENRVRYV